MAAPPAFDRGGLTVAVGIALVSLKFGLNERLIRKRVPAVLSARRHAASYFSAARCFCRAQ